MDASDRSLRPVYPFSANRAYHLMHAVLSLGDDIVSLVDKRRKISVNQLTSNNNTLKFMCR